MKKIVLSIWLLSIGWTAFAIGDPKSDPKDRPWLDTSLSVKERASLLVAEMTLEEKVSQMVNSATGIERLGVPEYDWWNECLHGVARNGKATVFPQAIGLAATFDENLIHQVADAIGKEARAKYNMAQVIGNRSKYSGLTFWTPNVNIFRDPRWGRGQETYGEDPFLTGRIGVNFVKGLQGNNPNYLQAAACAKHFAVHSGPEALRHEFNAVVSKQDLYETYLPAFKALVTEAHVESVMGAYNRVLDDPACGSEFLLKEILRDSWQFDGHIVSDCGALEDFYKYHKVTDSPAKAAAMALKAGLNLNCGNVYLHLVDAVKQGLVTEEMIDERLSKLYATRFKLGMFDEQHQNPYNSIDVSVVESEAHQELAYQSALKSMVLLKNKNNVLPLSPNIRNLYVVGPNASNSEVLMGNYYGLSSNTVTILDGIVANTSAGTTINYRQGILLDRPNVNPIDWTTGGVKASDACIAVLGISPLMEGEEGAAIASAAKGDRPDLSLPENQIEFLKKLRQNDETKPLIVILTGGSPIIAPEVFELADAVLFAWYPGQAGGKAVGDLIFGKASPSGKLPITFPKSMDQLPAYEDYNMKGRTYRYMEETPQFPFGYGLTYSKFEIGKLNFSKDKIKKEETLKVTAMVTNTGGKDAENVLQLYLSGYNVQFEAPHYSLKGFQRVTLKAGESKEVTFIVTPEAREIFDTEGVATQPKGKMTVTVSDAAPLLEAGRMNEISVQQKSITIR
ncbi:glycoside hydrolase family 3 N-terminal domain-containing protein [Limibacter armeniacum]|uniref:glycoside hydrolase family 3 N-terminal domain-containing protein n=1 Tax=Limibacter armeniacum TaxID=466084 RepID=UPI002FE6C4EC